MNIDQDTNTVIDILKNHMGFEAEKIIEGNFKRADISAWKNREYYLIEVKNRNDHPDLLPEITNKGYQISENKKELKRSNKISSIIKKASRQLDETPKLNNDFSCIWFRAVAQYIPDEVEFIKTSLFGIRHILVSDAMMKTYHSKCYYFDYNDFYNFQNINAVIIDNGHSIQICINNFSDRIEEFRNSELYSFFNKSNAVIDPEFYSKDSGIIVADIDCPRKETDKIKDYVQKKYGLQVKCVFKMESMAGIVYYEE